MDRTADVEACTKLYSLLYINYTLFLPPDTTRLLLSSGILLYRAKICPGGDDLSQIVSTDAITILLFLWEPSIVHASYAGSAQSNASMAACDYPDNGLQSCICMPLIG